MAGAIIRARPQNLYVLLVAQSMNRTFIADMPSAAFSTLIIRGRILAIASLSAKTFFLLLFFNNGFFESDAMVISAIRALTLINTRDYSRHEPISLVNKNVSGTTGSPMLRFNLHPYVSGCLRHKNLPCLIVEVPTTIYQKRR